MYVPAARSEDVGKKPLAVLMESEKIVLFRDDEGKICALRDLCPHMHVSLSLGKVINGHIQCAYHGLEFDRHGTCVKVPSRSDGPLPQEKVLGFDCLEQHGLIFINLDKNQKPNVPEINLPKKGFWFKTTTTQMEHLQKDLPANKKYLFMQGANNTVFVHLEVSGLFPQWQSYLLLRRLEKYSA